MNDIWKKIEEDGPEALTFLIVWAFIVFAGLIALMQMGAL